MQTSRALRTLVSILLLALSASLAAGQSQLAPLPLEESLHAFAIGSRYRLSPDGQWVAYSLRDTSKRELFNGNWAGASGNEGQDVWVVNTSSGKERNLTKGSGSSWSPVWSPDGNSLAFISDRDGQAKLWMWSKATDQIRRVADAVILQYGNYYEFRSWDYIQWAPNGHAILAKVLADTMTLKDREDYLRGSQNNTKSTQLGESSVTVYRWPVEETTAKSDGVTQENWRQKVLLGDLAFINITTGQVRRVARAVRPYRYDISPDGSYVSFLNAKGWLGNQSKWLFDLICVSLVDGSSYFAAANVSQSVVGMSVKWSPDSRQLAYVDGTPSDSDVFVVSPDGAKRNKLVHLATPEAFFTPQALPLWTPLGQELYVIGTDTLKKLSFAGGMSADVVKIPNRRIIRIVAPPGKEGQFWSTSNGRLIYLRTRDETTKREDIYKVDLSERTYEELSREISNNHDLASLEASLLGHDVVYIHEDAKHPPDLWIARPNQKQANQLTHANPVFEKYTLGESKLIEWRNSDGIRRQGALLLPAGYRSDKRYPLVVWVYGSNSKLSDAINGFGFDGFGNNMHLLTTRGYAVLFPDSAVNKGTPMVDIAKNVLPGIDKVIEMGIADPSRLGVMGHSYGGYSTLALIVQTTRFKAAVAYAGLADLVSVYGRMDQDGLSEFVALAEDGQLSMGGSPWEYRNRYIENSPLFYLDRVQTPLMLVCGDSDPLWSQSEEVFVGLRRLGKEVQYAKYKGVGHSIVYHPALLDYWSRLIAWFDSHLKNPEDKNLAPNTPQSSNLE